MHLDSIGWGVVAAIVGRWHPAAWARHQGAKAVLGLLLTLAGVAGLFYFMVVDWRGFAGGRFNDLALITAPALGTALMLPWLAGLCVGSAAVRRLAARLADYSYSMYLCHYPLMLVVLHAVKAQGWQAGPIVGWLLLAWLALVPRERLTLTQVTGWLTAHLSIMFVPAAVGVMEEGAILSRHGLGIVVAVGVSTLLTLAVTALVFRAVAGREAPDSEEGAS